MDAAKKGLLRRLKLLHDREYIISADFKNEKAKLFRKDPHSDYDLPQDLVDELKELKQFLDEEILDIEEYGAQKRVLLDRTHPIQVEDSGSLSVEESPAQNAWLLP